MPVSIALRRPKPSLVATVDAFLSEQLPPAPYSLVAHVFAVRSVLRVGDYEVGETYCPRLCGHPGIRY